MRRKAGFLLAGTLLATIGGCTSTPGRSSVSSYFQDRVLDAVDVIGIKWLFGKGMKAGIELGQSFQSTQYEDFFLFGLRRHFFPPNFVFGYYDMEKYGFQGRSAGIWRDKGFDLFGPIDRKLRVVAGNDYLFESVDEFNEWYRRAPERANTVPLDYPQPRYHYITDITMTMFFMVGLEGNFSIWQLTDFFLGWFHIDIVKDDAWNRTFDEFEDVQPQPEEFIRPQIEPESTGV